MVSKLRNLYLRIRGSQIRMGAVISYLAIAVNCVTALFYLPWMTKIIGQTNYGLYTLATSFIGLFLVDFGLGSAVSRFWRSTAQKAGGRIRIILFQLSLGCT